jgi:hypothetical protein
MVDETGQYILVVEMLEDPDDLVIFLFGQARERLVEQQGSRSRTTAFEVRASVCSG